MISGSNYDFYNWSSRNIFRFISLLTLIKIHSFYSFLFCFFFCFFFVFFFFFVSPLQNMVLKSELSWYDNCRWKSSIDKLDFSILAVLHFIYFLKLFLKWSTIIFIWFFIKGYVYLGECANIKYVLGWNS